MSCACQMFAHVKMIMAKESGLYLREKPKLCATTMEPISVSGATVITRDQTTKVGAFLTNVNVPMGNQ